MSLLSDRRLLSYINIGQLCKLKILSCYQIWGLSSWKEICFVIFYDILPKRLFGFYIKKSLFTAYFPLINENCMTVSLNLIFSSLWRLIRKSATVANKFWLWICLSSSGNDKFSAPAINFEYLVERERKLSTRQKGKSSPSCTCRQLIEI